MCYYPCFTIATDSFYNIEGCQYTNNDDGLQHRRVDVAQLPGGMQEPWGRGRAAARPERRQIRKDIQRYDRRSGTLIITYGALEICSVRKLSREFLNVSIVNLQPTEEELKDGDPTERAGLYEGDIDMAYHEVKRRSLLSFFQTMRTVLYQYRQRHFKVRLRNMTNGSQLKLRNAIKRQGSK